MTLGGRFTATELMAHKFAPLTAAELLATGECSAQCLLASGDVGGCSCACWGAYHGALAGAIVESVSTVRFDMAIQDAAFDRLGWCAGCRKRMGGNSRRLLMVDAGWALCRTCSDASTIEVHAKVYTECDKAWHDVWDHPAAYVDSQRHAWLMHVGRRRGDTPQDGTTPV